MANAACKSCGCALVALPVSVTDALCATCEDIEFALRKDAIDAVGPPPQAIDLLVECWDCGKTLTVTLEVAAHGPTPLGHVMCPDCDEKAEEWFEPFSEDDCPF